MEDGGKYIVQGAGTSEYSYSRETALRGSHGTCFPQLTNCRWQFADQWRRPRSKFRHNIQSNPSSLPEMRPAHTLCLFLLPFLVSVLDAGILRDVIETLEDLSFADMMDMIPTYGLQVSKRGSRLPFSFNRLRRKERVRPRHPQKVAGWERKGKGRNGNLQQPIRRPERAPVWYVEKTDNLLTETQSRDAELRWEEENWRALARQWGARLEEDWHRRALESTDYPVSSSSTSTTDSFSSSMDALTAELDSLTGWGEGLGLGTQVEPVVKRMRGILRRLALNQEKNRNQNLPDALADAELNVSDNQNRIISASEWEDVPDETGAGREGVQPWLEEPTTVSVSEWGRGAKGVTIFSSADSPPAPPLETTLSFVVNSSQTVTGNLPENVEGYREEVSSGFSDKETPRSFSNAEEVGFSEEEASKTNPYKFTMADAILHLPSNYRDPEDGGQLEKSGDSFTFYSPDEDFYDLSALASSETSQTEEIPDHSRVGTRRQGVDDSTLVETDNVIDDTKSVVREPNDVIDYTKSVTEEAGHDEEDLVGDQEKGIGGDKMLIYRAWLGVE